MARQDEAPQAQDRPQRKPEPIVFWAVIKRPDGEEIRKVTEKELMEPELMAANTELFNTEKDARDRYEAIARQRVFRAHQVAKAKAKVERDRAKFREEHPELAGELRRREELAREEEKALLAKRAEDAKTAKA